MEIATLMPTRRSRIRSVRRRQGRYGFTLIELLIIITIVTFLVAMLLPALKSTRATMKNVRCMNQQRQIHLAQAAYAIDNRGWFPPAKGAPDPSIQSHDGYWPNNWLLPYLRATDLPFPHAPWPDIPQPNVFACPAYHEQGLAPRDPNNPTLNNNYDHFFVHYEARFRFTARTYTLNYGLFHNAPPRQFSPLMRPNRVQRPGQKAYLVDGIRRQAGVVMMIYNVHVPSGLNHDTAEGLADLHPSGSNNVLYFDGHVATWEGRALEANRELIWNISAHRP